MGIQIKDIEPSSFLLCYLLCCTKWFQLLSLWKKSISVAIQMKAIEQYFPVDMVVLTFESVDGIL